MKISLSKPPCWAEANAFFKLEELNLGTIFTYGDTLYNPSNVELTQDLLVHEAIHAEQHQHNDTVAGLWWKRIIADPAFRLDQEARAYGAQFAYLKKSIKDRNAQTRALSRLAGHLSGPMYGNIVAHSEAMNLIRAHATGVR